jgi:hypothetical protein
MMAETLEIARVRVTKALDNLPPRCANLLGHSTNLESREQVRHNVESRYFVRRLTRFLTQTTMAA